MRKVRPNRSKGGRVGAGNYARCGKRKKRGHLFEVSEKRESDGEAASSCWGETAPEAIPT